MSASDFIDTVERFFLDIIGTILPGMALLLGCCYVSITNPVKVAESIAGSVDNAWIFLVVCAYISGHAVTSFGFQIVLKWTEYLASWKRLGRLLPFVMPESKIEDKLLQDPIFLAFKSVVATRIPSIREVALAKGAPIRVWRNLAIAIVQNDSQIIYRFTFISLLNLGIASALMIVIMAWLLLLAAQYFAFAVPVRELNIGAVLAIFASLLFLERYYQFNRRTLQVPFSMALVKLDLDNEAGSERKHSATKERLNRNENALLVVYLAGGFKSGWQDVVKAKIPSIRYLDPRSHGLSQPAQYTAWDLEAIMRSDLVFACLEASNPGGYALALEVGYARALGKCVVLVDDKSKTSPEVARHLEMVSQSSDVVFASLEEGIQFLDKFRSAV